MLGILFQCAHYASLLKNKKAKNAINKTLNVVIPIATHLKTVCPTLRTYA